MASLGAYSIGQMIIFTIYASLGLNFTSPSPNSILCKYREPACACRRTAFVLNDNITTIYFCLMRASDMIH